MRTRTYLILWSALLAGVVLVVILAGCSTSSSDVDALVSTSVAGTMSAQSDSEQDLPVSDGLPQTGQARAR